jgi:hypothetical protein
MTLFSFSPCAAAMILPASVSGWQPWRRNASTIPTRCQTFAAASGGRSGGRFIAAEPSR